MAAPYAKPVQWRFIVSNLAHETTTWLDHLAVNRTVLVQRAAPAECSLRVPSDNPEVNIEMPTPDFDPFVHEGTRLLTGLRREGRTGTADNPWEPRFAGLIMNVSDNADADHAYTDLTAYDPWKYMYRRPVLQLDGSLPRESGNVYFGGVRPDQIIMEQLILAEAYGSPTFIDYGQAGDGSMYTGVIEECEEIEQVGDGLAMSFPPGTMVGEMFDSLVALGTCDIVLEPIWDPLNRPGYLVQLSTLNRQGSYQPDAIFGWDAFPRNVVQLTRTTDGTERGNRMKFYASNNLAITVPIEDTASIAKYGDYWSMQTFPGFPAIATAQLLGAEQLVLLANGQITYQISLAPERAPMLFLEYGPGDRVPVHTTKRFRQAIPGEIVRVESIPIEVGDDDEERVSQLNVSIPSEPTT